MSGGEHHDKDCSEVLVELYRFIDNELDDASVGDIQHHLAKCGPCLRQHEVDLLVRRLLARSCADRAPQPLRDRVRTSLRVVQVELTDNAAWPGWRGPAGTL